MDLKSANLVSSELRMKFILTVTLLCEIPFISFIESPSLNFRYNILYGMN